MTLFMISTILLKHGLHYTPEGSKLFYDISNSMNRYRYYNNNIIPNVERILKVLAQTPIYDVYNTQDFNGRNIGRSINK